MPSKQLNAISSRIIGCAIEVHKRLGPGLLESVYEEAMCIEMKHGGLAFERQVPVPIRYREVELKTPLRADLLVSQEVLVELKALDELHPVHEAQILSYLRLTGKDLGLLLNFNVPVLKSGIRRFRRDFRK
ncbi:MAG: GxxExxY protein [Planctomycetota bacterium]|nr:GxxExxY protein [Planctomycetota bacterium]